MQYAPLNLSSISGNYHMRSSLICAYDFTHSENPVSLLSGVHTVHSEGVHIFCLLLKFGRDRKGNFRIYRAQLLVEVTLFEAFREDAVVGFEQ